MLGEAVLGDGEAVGVAMIGKQVEDLGVPIIEVGVGAPADDDEVGAFGDFDDGVVVVWADGVVGFFESFGVC